jgi:hypothetical protein
MVAETLIAWGARTPVFFGWCGAVSAARRPGFKDPRFASGREAACDAIGRLCSAPTAA